MQIRFNVFGCLTFLLMFFLVWNYKGSVDRLLQLKLAEAEHHSQCHKSSGCHGGHE